MKSSSCSIGANYRSDRVKNSLKAAVNGKCQQPPGYCIAIRFTLRKDLWSNRSMEKLNKKLKVMAKKQSISWGFFVANLRTRPSLSFLAIA